jgi:tetratricopeptide (TPR) repeat protein
MALSEIEKLERRYAENPQGLTFAPLAEVHRKNGDVARALELLRPGLTLHPDYIPASIVLGRCHLDLGDLPAAETAFGHVLGLDGENVIALKALADISERQARFDEAERWLRTLLAIDRSNDDARDQLGRVEAARRQAESAPVAAFVDAEPAEASVGAAAGVEGADALLDEEPLSIESGSVDPAAAEAAPAVSVPPMPEPPRDPILAWTETEEAGSADADAAPRLDLEELDTSVAFEAPRPEGIQLEQPVTLEDPVQPLAGLVGQETRVDEGGSLDVEDDFQVEMAEDIVLNSNGGSEFQMANAAEELLATRGEPGAEPSLGGPPAEVEPPVAEPAAAEPVAPVSAAPAPWAAPVAEPPREPEPELVVTESMAELLLQQGHRVEALTVYRHLAGRAGAEPRFQERIADLERMTAEPATPAPAYSVLVTHGQSVQAFLRGVLAARPPAAAGGSSVHSAPPRSGGPEPEGAPTRPAHDSLSLSSVFGEESTPTMPAVPAAGTPPPGQGGVSYDEFFGATGASGAPRAPRATDPKGDDLDQFHTWLQNLKR